MPPKKKPPGGSVATPSLSSEDSWAREQAVRTLNDAKLATEASQKCTHLKQLMELVVHKDSGLLNEFCEPILEMRVDANALVRKTIAGLCEQIGVASVDQRAACMDCVQGLLQDETAAVQKAAIKSASTLFKTSFEYVLTHQKQGTKPTKHTKDLWKGSNRLKDDLKTLALSETANDGVKMQAVRFLEKTLIILGSFDGTAGATSGAASGKKTVASTLLLDPDQVATEADSVLGVLLECLKPESIAAQAATASLVMIASAVSVCEKCPQYCEFVAQALVDVAEVLGGGESGGSANGAEDGSDAVDSKRDTPAVASVKKELRSAFVALLKLDTREMETFHETIDETLRTKLDGSVEADAAKQRRDRVTQRRAERNNSNDSTNKRRRLGLDDDEDEARSDTPDHLNATHNAGHQRITPPHLLAQVLQTMDALWRTDRAVLDGFVQQLAPEVLADVVLASLGNVTRVGGRVRIDVAAGMDAGAEGFVDWAIDTFERTNVDRGALAGGQLAHQSRDGNNHAVELDDDGAADADADETDETETEEVVDAKLNKKASAKPPGPFTPKVMAMNRLARRGQSAAALQRILKAADPSGAVVAMGGATVQRALLARLGTGVTAATARRDDDDDECNALWPVGGAGTRGDDDTRVVTGTSSVSTAPVVVSALSSAAFSSDGSEHKTVAGALLETLVHALPDPVAHQSVVRILGATFVNETLAVSEMSTFNTGKQSNAAQTNSGSSLYSRALMTVLVGLLAKNSPAHMKHFSKVVVDAPFIPRAATVLLRVLCRLPVTSVDFDGTSTGKQGKQARETVHGFSSDEKAVGKGAGSVKWGAITLPNSIDTVQVALATLLECVAHRQVVRGGCLEIALEAATSADEDVRQRAIRMVVTKLHPMSSLRSAVEQYAAYHLGEAAAAGAKALADARAVAAKAQASIAATKAKAAAAEKQRLDKARRLKKQAEGFGVTDEAAEETAVETAGTEPAAETAGETADEPAAVPDAEQEMLDRIERAAVQGAVQTVSKEISLFCALCKNAQNLLPKVFQAFASLPNELRPALLDGHNSFDALVRLVGSECQSLLSTVADPPVGSETLAVRAILVLVDAKRESDEFQRAAGGAVAGDDTADSVQKPQTLAGLVTAAESLARKQLPSLAGNATQVLVPLLGAMSADRVRKLLPALVAAEDSVFSDALDRLCGARARDEFGEEFDDLPSTRGTPAPLSASEILIALHDVDSFVLSDKDGKDKESDKEDRVSVPLKKIIAAVTACFNRPSVFTAEVFASALSRMVTRPTVPLLFMRTVIQAESSYPALKDFTLGLLRQLVTKKVWRGDSKIWEGFIRCAKRAAPRSFPVLCQLPEVALVEVLSKFPALTEPLRTYVNAPAVAGSVPRAVRDALAKA